MDRCRGWRLNRAKKARLFTFYKGKGGKTGRLNPHRTGPTADHSDRITNLGGAASAHVGVDPLIVFHESNTGTVRTKRAGSRQRTRFILQVFIGWQVGSMPGTEVGTVEAEIRIGRKLSHCASSQSSEPVTRRRRLSACGERRRRRYASPSRKLTSQQSTFLMCDCSRAQVAVCSRRPLAGTAQQSSRRIRARRRPGPSRGRRPWRCCSRRGSDTSPARGQLGDRLHPP